jgi:murein DD-endopeptidase MepM/ murein hydrolase activator NlpD
VGYIETELVFAEAEKVFNDRLNFLGSTTMIDMEPRYSIEKVGNSRILTVPEVTNILIEKSGISVEWAYGIIINNTIMGAVTDNTSIIATLERLLNEHKTPGALEEEVAFTVNVDVEQGGLYPTGSIVDPQDIIRSITRRREEAQFYTVIEGDSISLISEKLDIRPAELERLNPGLSGQVLQPGDRIQFSVDVPYIPVSVTRTEIYNHPIAFSIEYREDPRLIEGNTNIAVAGQPGYEQVTARVTLIDGVETGRRTISRVLVSEPVTQIISRGTMIPPLGRYSTEQASYGKFIWPLPRDVSRVSEPHQDDGGYRGHSGIDLAAPHGTPIFAGANGTVIFSGWQGGYGNLIIIDHDNGLRTYYSHNSQNAVREGDVVSQGQTIGFVGMTGRADGNHLHFEVRYQSDNRTRNPANYLDFW